jgi:hypothetical protein
VHVTLSTGLGTNSIAGDVVAIYNRMVNFIATNKPSCQFNLSPIINASEGCLYKYMMPTFLAAHELHRFNTFDTATPFLFNIFGISS